MRIGINLLYLIPGKVGGTEAYAAGLLGGLAHCDREDEFYVFVNQEAAEWPIPGPNFKRIVCPVQATSRSRRYIYEQLFLPNLIKRCKIELLHSLGYVSPLITHCPTVVTIHDLNYRAFGSQMPVTKRLMLALFIRASALRSRHVITGSQFAAREIAAAFGLAAGKGTVIYYAPRSHNPALMGNAPDLFHRFAIHPPYFLAFSSYSSNKNIPRLLEAFSVAKERHSLAHELVLVGHPYPSLVPSSADSDVVFTGYLREEDLDVVLVNADWVVFPSTYEGFGLPVLDAMTAGVPVTCSNVASLPEIAGDAAKFFDPLSVDDIAAKIALMAQDPGLRQRLREAGFENVKRFSWEKAASETLRVYKEILDERVLA